MSWQEDLHRRNVAEAAATRTRIEQGNRDMQARMRVDQVRAAKESQTNHDNFMRDMGAPTHVVRPVKVPSWTPSVGRSNSNYVSSPTPRTTCSSGSKPASKYDKVLGGFFLVAVAVWIFGNGHAALVVAGIGIGLVLLAATVALLITAVRGFIRILPKLIGIALFALVLYVIFAHR